MVVINGGKLPIVRSKMASAENFFGNITVDPGYFAILDLDLTENIAHPYWEILDPNPDINELFERFNNLLFDGTFTDEQRKKVTLNWFENKRGPLAGETYPPNSKKPIRIRMNERVLKPVLRKEVIETLIVSQIDKFDQHKSNTEFGCLIFLLA